MNIIPQLMKMLTTGYLEIYEEALKQGEMTEIVSNTMDLSNKISKHIVEDIISNLEDEIKISDDRKRNWYIQRNNDVKTVSTLLGSINYKRTYYKNKNSGEYTYLLDEHLGINPHERMDDSLKAKIIEDAIGESYQSAINRQHDKGVYSRTTVMNAIRSIKEIPNDAAPVKLEKKKIENLYVEADEDHVSLQNGSSTISKIIYVHEGKKLKSKGRYELINVRYFTDLKQNSEDLWLDVASYIDEVYETEKIKRVFLSGDGASWIKEGLNWIVNSEFVLDKFHLAKYVREATAHQEQCFHPMWNYINRDMKKAAKDLFDLIIEETKISTKRKAVIRCKGYILNHWEAIQLQKDENYLGCSAEGHVSHVLSDRLSSRPMGWSKYGMEQMARLRVMDFNGGKVFEHIKNLKLKEEKNKNITKLDNRICLNKVKKNFKGYGNIDNITIINQGKRTGAISFLKSVRGI